jgi:hypothetical protein
VGPVDVTADDGVRTRDLRFTKPLLYRLSYVGGKGQNIASSGGSHKRAAVAASLCEAIDNAARNTLYLLLPTLTGRVSHRRGYRGSMNVSPISRSAMRSGVLLSAASKRSIGSRKGSKLSRNV